MLETRTSWLTAKKARSRVTSRVGVQPKIENGATSRRRRCSLPYSSEPPRPVRNVRKANRITNQIMKRNARRISFHVTPEVRTTKMASSHKGSKKRTSQKARVENRKQA